MLIVAGIVGTVLTFLVGWWIDSVITTGKDGLGGTNVDYSSAPPPTTCDDFCTRYQSARMRVCVAEKALQAAGAYAQHLAWLTGLVLAAAIITPWLGTAVFGIGLRVPPLYG
jgi:hypothetical protein